MGLSSDTMMIDFPYRIVKTKRKTIALRILPNGEVEVRCPFSTCQRDIHEVLQKHTTWIARQREKCTSIPRFNENLSEGSILFYLGESYPLLFTPEKTFSWNGEAFRCPLNKKAALRKTIEKWYKAQAKFLITERVLLYAHQYGFSYKKIRISSANKRYGSCSANNHLSFTWKLILLPLDLIDYVVVHELVHTAKKHHQKNFWAIVSTILPNYKEREKLLKTKPFSAYWFP